MQLHITRNKREDPVVFESTFRLKDDGNDPRIVPPHLSDLRLELLAQRWLATRDTPPDKDMNAVLCQDVDGWSNATMAALASGLTLASEDSVLIAAVEERVKRACGVIADNYLYKTHYAEQESLVFPLLPTRPPGSAVPAVSVDVFAKATGQY